MTYQEQLLHSKWLAKRNTILKRDNYKCTKCNNTTNLQVHHKEYHTNAKAWEYRNEYLVTLCSQCHKLEHLTTVIPTNDTPPYKYTPPKNVKSLEQKREERKLKKEKEKQYYSNLHKSLIQNYKEILPSCIKDLDNLIIQIRKINNTIPFDTMEIWYDEFDLQVNNVKDWKHEIPYDIVEEYLISRDHVKRIQERLDEFTKQLESNEIQ